MGLDERTRGARVPTADPPPRCTESERSRSRRQEDRGAEKPRPVPVALTVQVARAATRDSARDLPARVVVLGAIVFFLWRGSSGDAGLDRTLSVGGGAAQLQSAPAAPATAPAAKPQAPPFAEIRPSAASGCGSGRRAASGRAGAAGRLADSAEAARRSWSGPATPARCACRSAERIREWWESTARRRRRR